MEVKTGEIKEEFDRDLYWVRLLFISDDGKRKSQIMAAVSQEYLEDYYQLPNGTSLQKENFDSWLLMIKNKWLALGEEIFNQDVHYDTYFNTAEGDSNGLNFLLSKNK